MVFYRKYRPQKIADLDSTAVRETLQAILSKDVPHAFLFTGPKGLGKTSTARIVAKSVNCEKKKKGDIEPCNACEQCTSITDGTNLDVLEIDAASNRGIDEIRDLKEKIRLSPVSSKKKVYIIDEVHMLTTEAFNALLKTIEEPPSHAMFVLATTEPHKVPATILSRCFHINFNLATDEEIVRSLKRVAEGEKLQIDEDVFTIIAQLSDGGFRDGAKLLEELVLLAGDTKITKELVASLHKSSHVFAYIAELLVALQQSDAKKGLEVVGNVVSQGMDMRYFIAQIIEELHRMLLVQYGIKNPSSSAGRQEARIKDVHVQIEDIQGLVGLFAQAYQETKFAVVQSLPLELAIIEWTNVATDEADQSPSEAAALSGGLPLPSGPAMTSGVTVSSLRKQVGARRKTEALYGSPPKVKEEKAVIETATVELQHTSGDGTVTKEWMDHFWNSLINEIKKHNHTAAGVLRSCAIKSYDNNKLVIATAYSFHKERLEESKTRNALHEVCKMLTGKNIEVTIELKR
jgi:DNA polymerase-3 subunit gamma/tau